MRNALETESVLNARLDIGEKNVKENAMVLVCLTNVTRNPVTVCTVDLTQTSSHVAPNVMITACGIVSKKASGVVARVKLDNGGKSAKTHVEKTVKMCVIRSMENVIIALLDTGEIIVKCIAL